MVVKWRKRRHGEWIPEDRLRAAILGAGVLVPSSLILCGIFTTFVPGTLGIVLNMVAFFMNGLGVSFPLRRCSTLMLTSMWNIRLIWY